MAAAALAPVARATELGVQGTRFILDGRPAFLLGCSYYAGLGASDATITSDLDELKRRGFNWVRVWATWAAFDNDVSAVDADGNPRPKYLERLRHMVDECDRRGLVVDVTLSRGNGATGSPRLQGLAPHRRAIETIVSALRDRKNWYIDLSNERNIRDKRFTSVEDLADLRALVRKLDPGRLVTASHAGDVDRDDVGAYVKTIGVDFLSIHRPRDEKSSARTAARTREVLKWAHDAGRALPVHYDEPFRRGYGDWQPRAADFLADLDAAKTSGAAGWCFHNGSQRGVPNGRPRRSFDLRDHTLFEQLDEEETAFLSRLVK